MREFGASDRALLDQVLQSGRLGRAPDGLVRRLGRRFADRVGAEYGIPRNANLTALSQLLAVAGVGAGHTVLCDPLVQYGGVAALTVGATPVFVDVRADTYNLDERELESAITGDTKAVIVTHLWGVSADMAAISEICASRGLFLIEDCAHAIGATWAGRHAGTFGDAGVFSFHQNKQLCTGDGGLVVTPHAWIHDLLYNEWPSGESPDFLTLNYHMNELTAAVGLAQLDRVDDYLAEYRASFDALDHALADASWIEPRTVPADAGLTPYWWAALCVPGPGGVDLARLVELVDPLDEDMGFFFTERPAPDWPLFARDTAREPATLPASREVLNRVLHIPVIEVAPRRAAALGARIREIGDRLCG